MSQKQKHGSPGTKAPRSGGGKKIGDNGKEKYEIESNHNENIVRKLYECFQDIFDYDLVASVCHTCEWDAGKASEALMVLGDATYVARRRNSKGGKGDKNKPKSLPSTLKPTKSDGDKSGSLYAMPESLKSNPAHVSTSSLSSGQVWQRHYKSKPQSPGLLTMIPPYSKEGSKLKKSGSSRSLPAQSTPSKTKDNPEVKIANAIVKRIQKLVENDVKVLILMRGVPGSGKTHLAQIVINLVTKGSDLSQHIFSTDDYFIMLGRGNYAYDSNQLPLAHHWNQRRVFEALRRSTNPVIVDNTHTQAWEMEPYVSMAVSQGYLIEVLEPFTPWRNKEAELAKRNIHSVPREKIRQMLERYERGWTGEKLTQLFGLTYKSCGSSHVTQESAIYNNSPLAQHRQQGVVDTPEKPKRKKNSPKKKDRRHLAGIEITEDKEKQLEELNQLFAEYGKKMDPISKKKVLESGVPISEVVSRMRKLQGNVLPLPKSNVYPPTIPEKDGLRSSRTDGLVELGQKYSIIPRESPCESLEPDTMSSSNASETSECESDTEEAPNLQGMNSIFKYRHNRQFVDGDNVWSHFRNDCEVKGKTRLEGSCKSHRRITSSQEDLSIIDFDISTNPACSSQEEFSLLDFDDADENKNDKEGSSSSSEEQETQLLTLQESLREALIDSYEKRKQLEEENLTKVPENKDLINKEQSSDAFINAVSKRLENIRIDGSNYKDGGRDRNDALVDYILELESKSMDSEVPKKRSPDLEEVPLPSIPPQSQEGARAAIDQTLDSIMNTWETPVDKEVPSSQPKPERPKSGLLGAIKKTGIQRDQSPEELLRSVELSWSSIPFTSSWEDINKKTGSEKRELPQRPKSQRRSVNKVDSSTNTKHSDFELWKDDTGDVVKLTPQNRNINQNVSVSPTSSHYVTEHPMLDKGSMTSDLDEYNMESFSESLELLSGMFPDIQPDSLSDVLEKCKGDIHWAVNLLLDSPHNVDVSVERKPSQEAVGTDADGNIPLEKLVISDGKKTIKRRKDRKSMPSELSLMLKKQIEEGIHINEECYQKKTLLLKQMRHPSANVDYSTAQSSFGDPALIPEFQPMYYNTQVPANSAEAEVVQDEEEEIDEEEEEEDETIPMKIDPEFFQQLATRFGHTIARDQLEGPNSVSVINIPFSLGYQIYGCWLETMNRQIEDMQAAYDNMIKEDELLAKALQEQEHDQHKPDLREIMDMELAMALYKQDEEFNQGNMETMACKLTKQLLIEAFPNVHQKVILDLFRSQGYSFQKTTDMLGALNKVESPKTVHAPEFLQAYEKKLIEQVKQESKKEAEVVKKPIIVVKTNDKSSKDSQDVLFVNPAEYRQKMSLLQKRRNDCCKQAQEAFRKKSYSVASYYSHIASMYRERIAEMNKKSISLKLFENERPGKSSKWLDLHLLYVTEALQVVDIFLDEHIVDLNRRNLSSTDLYLITGQGRHSISKAPKIKPAVMKKLDQRNIFYVEQNPGLLKLTVYKTNCLSNQS